MYFDDKYFKTEEIDGFVVDSMMKRAWAAEMEIMQEIDRICKENDLQYYAAWGTLLGTIRHKGFIPWDDDIDIWMKRKDYNRFIEIIKKELDSTFCICHYSTLEQWDQYFLRITNGREINTNEEHLKRFHGFPFVAGVDVFPLDYISDDEEEEDGGKSKIKFAPLAVFCTFFIAELGDKTQLTAITFGANEGMSAALVVWIGCSLGLFAADILGMLVGYLLKSKTPDGLLNTLAFAIFSIFGVYTLYQGLKLIRRYVCPIPVWPILIAATVVFVVICVCLFIRREKEKND